MNAKPVELWVHIEVDKWTVSRWCNSGFQHSIAWINRAIWAIIGASLDIRCLCNVENINLAIDWEGRRLAEASTRISSHHKELPILDEEDFGLSRNLGILRCFGSRVHVEWQRDYEFSCIAWCWWDGDIVFNQTSIAFGLFGKSPFLDQWISSIRFVTWVKAMVVGRHAKNERTKTSDDLISCGLKQDIESVPIPGHSQAFESVVAVSSGRIVCRDHIIPSSFRSIKGGRVGREGLGSISHWNDYIIRPDGCDHNARRIKSMNIWACNIISLSCVPLMS